MKCAVWIWTLWGFALMYASRCAGPLHCVCAVGASWSNFNGITENCRAYGVIRVSELQFGELSFGILLVSY